MKPEVLIFGIAAGGVGLYLWSQKNGADSRMGGLPDVDSRDQGGVFKRDYDAAFERAANRTGVPFALIKAHAIRESSLNSRAYRDEGRTNGASYGLMQLLWGGTREWIVNRFAVWGFPDSSLEMGNRLYDPNVNAELGAQIIKDNLTRFGGNLRDSINAYNTGVRESVREAPGNYVDDVLGYYGTLCRKIL